ncbi:glutamine amidotransferase, partial [Ralstonia solanacearum]
PALAAPLAQRAHDVFTAWLDRAEAHAARSAA